MPVSVPVNPGPYGDGSMLHASPQMHSSASPRPSSSSGMLDVGNNGYPSNASPVPESPPLPSSSLKNNSMVRPLSPQQPTHLNNHIQRPNLRVVIPAPQSGLAISSHDRGDHF